MKLAVGVFSETRDYTGGSTVESIVFSSALLNRVLNVEVAEVGLFRLRQKRRPVAGKVWGGADAEK